MNPADLLWGLLVRLADALIELDDNLADPEQETP